MNRRDWTVTYTWDRREGDLSGFLFEDAVQPRIQSRTLLASARSKIAWHSSIPHDRPGRYQHVFLPTTRLYLDDSNRYPRSKLSEEEIDEQFTRIINNNWLSYYNEVITKVGEIQKEGLSSVLTYALADETIDSSGPLLNPEQAFYSASRFLSRQSTDSPAILGTKHSFIERYKSDQKLRWLVDELNKTEEKIERAQLSLNKFIFTISDLFSNGKKISGNPNDLSIALSSGRIIPPSLLSSGEKHLLQILISSMLTKDHAIIIDEPELSLHIDWQRKLIDTIKSLNPWCQIIMASHSPEIMANISDDKIFKV